MSRRPVVLTYVRYYLPGFRSGGPVRSLSNLVDALGAEYDFRIVCLDRDKDNPYPSVPQRSWVSVGGALVCYTPARDMTPWRILQHVRDTGADLAYFNSLFDPLFSRLPDGVMRGLRCGPPVLLAPRGELSEGALEIRRCRKQAYLRLSRWASLHAGVTWHASTSWETDDIQRELSPPNRVFVAADLVKLPALPDAQASSRKPFRFRIVFLSRVGPKKNVLGAIRMVHRMGTPVDLDIWGPIDDEGYWRQCLRAISGVPPHVRIVYRGAVPHEGVASTLSGYDVFLLPTLGENFGHVIFEALACGLPCVISDRTPWRNLRQAGVGADLPLEGEDAFVRVLEEYAVLDGDARARVRRTCRAFAERWHAANTNLDAYRRMFEVARRPGVPA